MTNVVTMPGSSPPRLVPSNDGHRLPQLRSKENDAQAELTLSHFQIMRHCAHYIARNESKAAARDKLRELIEELGI